MVCYSPITLKERGLVVPCGCCFACEFNRSTDWQTRMVYESRQHRSNLFVTLTYSEDCLPANNMLVKKDVQQFIHALRKHYRFRYFAVGEYGPSTLRPHYHLILFGLHDEAYSRISNVWHRGFVMVKNVVPQMISYVAGYCWKKAPDWMPYQKREDKVMPFAIMSRNPGIGACYLTPATRAYHQKNKITYMVLPETNGIKRRMPRYYKERLFTKEEREQMATDYMSEKVRNSRHLDRRYQFFFEIYCLDSQTRWSKMKLQYDNYVSQRPKKVMKL